MRRHSVSATMTALDNARSALNLAQTSAPVGNELPQTGDQHCEQGERPIRPRR